MRIFAIRNFPFDIYAYIARYYCNVNASNERRVTFRARYRALMIVVTRSIEFNVRAIDIRISREKRAVDLRNNLRPLSYGIRRPSRIHSLSRRLVYPRPYQNVLEPAVRDGGLAMDTILRKHDRSIALVSMHSASLRTNVTAGCARETEVARMSNEIYDAELITRVARSGLRRASIKRPLKVPFDPPKLPIRI